LTRIKPGPKPVADAAAKPYSHAQMTPL
jgi:hypothetical protein